MFCHPESRYQTGATTTDSVLQQTRLNSHLAGDVVEEVCPGLEAGPRLCPARSHHMP